VAAVNLRNDVGVVEVLRGTVGRLVRVVAGTVSHTPPAC